MHTAQTVYTLRALTRDGARITSHVYLDQLYRVLAARVADHGMLEGAAFQPEEDAR